MVKGVIYHAEFSLDDGSHFLNNSCYFLPTGDLSVLACMNSRVIWWYADRHLAKMKDDAYYPHREKIMILPIPEFDEKTRTIIDEKVGMLLNGDVSNDERIEIEKQLTIMIYSGYNLNQSQIEVIETTLNPRDPLTIVNKK